MDNAGSTNKNMCIMGATMEVVHEDLDLFHFLRISFMVAGCTKFDQDCLFSNIARAFNQSDVFNIDQLAELIQLTVKLFAPGDACFQRNIQTYVVFVVSMTSSLSNIQLQGQL